MDYTADVEVIEPLEVRSEGLTVSVGEKRPAENGKESELEVRSLKKAKNDGGMAGNMKKVAEIVLVLATMGKMRAGRNPTPAEIEMITEAREKLVEVCQRFAPKDVFPRDAFGAVIEDLGLSKLREQRLGFCPPKMSIAEKLKLTKQKMEKSEEFSLHSATYSSQRLQTNVGAAAESRGTSHAVRMFSSGKPSQAPISSGGFRPASPLGHVSAANSTPLPYQLPTSEVKSVVSSGLPSSHLGRDSSSLALPRAERPHFRLDGKSNGASYTSLVQENSYGDHTMVKTPTWSIQTQSASLVKIGSENKVPAHSSIKVEGAADMPRVAPQATTSKPFITQTTSVNPPSIHQYMQQGVKFVQAPSLSNSHNEIGKSVQKLLQPQLPEHPMWTPPSRDYMNKALTCQTCKLIINEVGNVLVCDACEKGYHLKCLHFHNQKSIPRDEWHCGKCLSLSNGKPLPPKYGRVMRNISAPKVSSNATAVQSSSEKKVGTLDGKVNRQRITVNGNSGLQSVSTGTMDNTSSHFADGVEMTDARVMQGNDTLSSKGKKDDEHPSGSPPHNLMKISAGEEMGDARVMPGNNTLSSKGIKDDEHPSGSGPNNLMKTSGSACVTPADLSVEKLYEEKLAAESKSQPPANSETIINMFDHSQALGDPQDNDQTGTPNICGNPSKQCPDTNLKVKESEISSGGKFLGCNTNDEDKQGVSLANHIDATGNSVGPSEHGGFSSDGLHEVDWIGDVLQVVDEKTYYQSCSINGVVYKVQGHVLFRSINNKLTPSKLQGMWEDNKTRLKWVVASRCYFPADLPEAVGCPCAPEINEVYESNHDNVVMAGLIEAPCEVLPTRKFIEESERRTHLRVEESDGLQALFICKWFFDEPKGLFRAVTS